MRSVSFPTFDTIALSVRAVLIGIVNAMVVRLMLNAGAVPRPLRNTREGEPVALCVKRSVSR
jgi:hypothetical protein